MHEIFRLDVRQVRRAFDRAALAGADSAILQAEVEKRMLERLDYVRLRPGRLLDAGCGTGRGLRLLGERYPEAIAIGADFAPAVVRAAERSQSVLERVRGRFLGPKRVFVCTDFSKLPLRAASVELVWSNLALAWAQDLVKALREFHRVLDVGGLLMFSSYGPDTLRELKNAFSNVSRARRVHSFLDMHEVGDLLVTAGFSDPVMDMEVITLTYTDVGALARDLKNSGETYAAGDRSAGLLGRDTWRRMMLAYERERRAGRLPASFEVIYGQAWRGEKRAAPTDARHVVRWEKITRR